jgi:hypothetical protein
MVAPPWLTASTTLWVSEDPAVCAALLEPSERLTKALYCLGRVIL